MDTIDKKGTNGFIVGFISAFIIISLFWGIGKGGKYEGQTAQEWFEEYSYYEGMLDDMTIESEETLEELEVTQQDLDDFAGCVDEYFPSVWDYCSY